jgi:hypothetical protein
MGPSDIGPSDMEMTDMEMTDMEMTDIGMTEGITAWEGQSRFSASRAARKAAATAANSHPLPTARRVGPQCEAEGKGRGATEDQLAATLPLF